MRRAPAEQTWPLWKNAAFRAWSTAVSKPSSVAQASANTTLGFFPPSSRATFLTVGAAAWATFVPLASPPVKETRSTSGCSESRAPTGTPAPVTRLATPSGSPASARSRIRWTVESGVTSLGLSTKVLPHGEGGGDLPAGLEQRVVPRGDQGADADRLVHDDAVHVGVARVDDPAAALVHDEVGEVAEGVGDVVDVDAALLQGLAGVAALGDRDLLAVPLEEPGDPAQQLGALGDGLVGPGAVVEGAACGGHGCVGVLGSALGDECQDGGVRGVEDLASGACSGGLPDTVDVEGFQGCRGVSRRAGSRHVVICLPCLIAPHRSGRAHTRRWTGIRHQHSGGPFPFGSDVCPNIHSG